MKLLIAFLNYELIRLTKEEMKIREIFYRMCERLIILLEILNKIDFVILK